MLFRPLKIIKKRVNFARMATLAPHEKRHKVTVVGSGNWYVIEKESPVSEHR